MRSSSLKFQVIATDLDRIKQNADKRLCRDVSWHNVIPTDEAELIAPDTIRIVRGHTVPSPVNRPLIRDPH